MTKNKRSYFEVTEIFLQDSCVYTFIKMNNALLPLKQHSKSPEALQPKLTKAPAISTLTNLYLSPRLFLDNIPYKIK